MTRDEERRAEEELLREREQRMHAARATGFVVAVVVVGILASWLYVVELVTSGGAR